MQHSIGSFLPSGNYIYGITQGCPHIIIIDAGSGRLPIGTISASMFDHNYKYNILIHLFWSPISCVLVLCIFFIGLGSWTFSDSLKADPPAKGKGSLRLGECKELYKHQLQLARKKDSPLAFALGLNLRHLRNKATQHKQAYHCQRNINRDQYNCQMQADSFLSLIACKSKEEQRQEVHTSPQSISELKVDKNHCTKSYKYILRLVKQSKDFQQRKDQKELEKHWRSPEAQKSFQGRCLKHFRKEDLKCIEDAQDMDILSGCLLAIPE